MSKSQGSPEVNVLTKKEQIQSLRDAISHKQPVVFGTSVIPTDQWTLFYGEKGNAGRIDLANASETDLSNLSEACQPAKFGVNQKDVLDESYRKARKMDVTDFATKFTVADSSLMDAIRSELLEGHDSNKSIKAELYKLNVYGNGAFFKSHKDTPRSSAMFGSLVVVFPTKHDGGALTFRHGGGEWTFDSAAMLKSSIEPSIAYVAFYSDVEHEVAPVISGRRVTLTYNLYFSADAAHDSVPPIVVPSKSEAAFQSTLATLLSDNTFMPRGGLLGFGLRHEYPLELKAGLGTLINCLKGNDAIIQRVCSQLSLQTMLRVVYADETGHSGPYFVMVKDIVDYSEQCDIGDVGMGEVMTEFEDGIRVSITGSIADELRRTRREVYDSNHHTEDRHIDVDWVTDLTKFTVAKTSYIAYGNEACMNFIYGNVCLLVNVGPPGDRAEHVKEPAKKKSRYY